MLTRLILKVKESCVGQSESVVGGIESLKSDFSGIVTLKSSGWNTGLLKQLNGVVDNAAKAGALGGSRFALAMAEVTLNALPSIMQDIQSEFFQCLEATEVQISDTSLQTLRQIVAVQVGEKIAETRQILLTHPSIRPNSAFGDDGAKEALASKTFDADAPRLAQISDSEVMRALNKLKSSSSQTSSPEKFHTLVSPEASQAVGLAGFGIAGALATNLNSFLYFVGLCSAVASIILIGWVYRRIVFSGKSLSALLFPIMLILAVALFTGGMVIHWGKKTPAPQSSANVAITEGNDTSSVSTVEAPFKVLTEPTRSSQSIQMEEPRAPLSTTSGSTASVAPMADVAISSTASAPPSSATLLVNDTVSAADSFAVRADCSEAKMPRVVPADSRVNYVSLSFNQDALDYAQYSVRYPEKPGSKIRYTDRIWGPTYQCTIVNSSDVTLYDVFINVSVLVNEISRDKNVYSQGKQLLRESRFIHIGKLDNINGREFKIFVFSKSEKIFDLQVGKIITARPEESDRQINIVLRGDRSDRHISIWPVG